MLKLRNNEWCEKCFEKLQKCQHFAQTQNWTLVNDTFLPELIFKCHLGHTIIANSKKQHLNFLLSAYSIFSYEHKISCLTCKKIAREEHLEHLRKEEERKNQERAKNQV